MIAVDANVVLRLLANDDAAQAAKARKLFDAMAAQDASIWLSDTVLVEVVWTLSRAYGHARAALVVAVRALLQNATVAFESAHAVQAALVMFESGPADFADCLLVAKAKAAGCDDVLTFDRKMRTLPGVKLL